MHNLPTLHSRNLRAPVKALRNEFSDAVKFKLSNGIMLDVRTARIVLQRIIATALRTWKTRADTSFLEAPVSSPCIAPRDSKRLKRTQKNM